jgi:hypothetical protein
MMADGGVAQEQVEPSSEQQVQELAEYLKSVAAGTDLQISAFYCALSSYRRASGK